MQPIAIQCNPNQYSFRIVDFPNPSKTSQQQLFQVMLPKQEILSNFAHYYKDNPMKNDKEMKTITIRQGSGDDALEMTVQVTQAEFDKMEELRSINPQKWPDYSLELIKEAREVLAKPTKQKPKKPQSTNKSKRKWLWIVLAIILAAIGIALWLFAHNTSIIQGSDLDFQQLKGKVKSVYSLEFDAINEFGEGNLVFDKPSDYNVTIQHFDSLGNLSRDYSISITDKYLSGFYILNKNGLPIEKKVYISSDDKGMQYYYEYDNKGNIIHEIDHIGDYRSEKTTTYQFDVDGKILSEHTVYHDGDFSTTTYQYDNLGRITKSIITDAHQHNHITEYFYTNDGYKKKLTRHIGEYTIIGENIQWKYDIDNHRNDILHYDKNDKLEYKESDYYDKDSMMYMSKRWNKEGALISTYYYYNIINSNDTISFITKEDDYTISHISIKTLRRDSSICKQYSINPIINSINTYHYTDKHHLTIKQDSSIVTVVYDSKMNPKTSIETFADGRNIKAKYSYKGNKNQWLQTKTMQSDSDKKETVTRTYSEFNLISVNESDGHEKLWEYNESGELIAFKERNGSLINYEIKFSDYAYDKYGNWIRRTNYNVLADTYTVTERCIKYYRRQYGIQKTIQSNNHCVDISSSQCSIQHQRLANVFHPQRLYL